MPKPTDYIEIRKHGERMGSLNGYIESMQQQAAADNAPLDAIYRRSKADGGGWFTLRDREESEKAAGKRKAAKVKLLALAKEIDKQCLEQGGPPPDGGLIEIKASTLRELHQTIKDLEF